LCISLFSLSKRTAEQHSPVLHIRALVSLVGLKYHVVNKARHKLLRVAGPGL
jgi:hypothetical protein